MATSTEIKQRANALADKTDVNSITPKEVGGIMYDLASHGENVLRNGGTLGIRKVYESVAAMEADGINPVDLWGNPIKKGNLVVIYDGTTTGVDNNKVYAFMNPGWELATKIDAGYATKVELSELGSKYDTTLVDNLFYASCILFSGSTPVDTGVGLEKDVRVDVYIKTLNHPSQQPISLYTKNEDGSWSDNVVTIPYQDAINGTKIKYIPNVNSNLYIRSYTYGSTIEFGVALKETSSESIQKLKEGNIYFEKASIEKNISINTTLVQDSGIDLDANKRYKIFIKCNKSIAANHSVEVGLWNGYTQLTSISAENMYNGVSFYFTPKEQVNLYVRTNTPGVDVSINVLKDLSIVNVLDSINKNTLMEIKKSSAGSIAQSTPYNTALILTGGIKNYIYVKITEGDLSSAEAYDLGLWTWLSSSWNHFARLTAEEMTNGITVEYTPPEDCTLFVRTIVNSKYEASVSVNEKTSDYILRKEKEWSEVEIKESSAGSIAQSTPYKTGLKLTKGVDNNVYVKITGDLSGAEAYDLGLWTWLSNGWYHFARLTAGEMNNGVTVKYNPTEDCFLYVRTIVNSNYEASVSTIKKLTDYVQSIQGDTSQWQGKSIAFYGDSITAITNGNYESPFPYTKGDNVLWGNVVAEYFGAKKVYGRGIGGQRYEYGTLGAGGSVCWVDTNGNYLGRNDNKTYDNFNGEYPDGLTKEMEDAGNIIRTKGSFSSWLRIITMFPESIKSSIDVVCVMGGTNDSNKENEIKFVTGSTVDTEWANSQFYSTYGGDYNIETMQGGIASTVMKLQAWMPNALIVIMTPLSGRGVTGQLNLTPVTLEYEKTKMIKNVAAMFSCPLIDVNSSSGINGLNRTTYITDNLHPYSAKGNKMLARTVIGGLTGILPINFEP